MLSVFGDESSDEKKQRVFAVAGVIGSEEMWNAIEPRWVSRTGGIPFHANNCDSDQGDYRKHSALGEQGSLPRSYNSVS